MYSVQPRYARDLRKDSIAQMPYLAARRTKGQKKAMLDFGHARAAGKNLFRGRCGGKLCPPGVTKRVGGIIPFPVYADTAAKVQICGKDKKQGKREQKSAGFQRHHLKKEWHDAAQQERRGRACPT